MTWLNCRVVLCIHCPNMNLLSRQDLAGCQFSRVSEPDIMMLHQKVLCFLPFILFLKPTFSSPFLSAIKKLTQTPKSGLHTWNIKSLNHPGYIPPRSDHIRWLWHHGQPHRLCGAGVDGGWWGQPAVQPPGHAGGQARSHHRGQCSVVTNYCNYSKNLGTKW